MGKIVLKVSFMKSKLFDRNDCNKVYDDEEIDISFDEDTYKKM